MENNTNNTEATQETEDNFGFVDPNKEIVTATPEELAALKKDLLILPVDTLKAIRHFVSETIKTKENFREYIKDNISSTFAMQSTNAIPKADVYQDKLDQPDLKFNQVKYGDKELAMKEVEMSAENITPKTAIARFTKYINAGEVIQVPLWHSGFWVTIRPPKQKDFIILEQEIADNHVKLGRETASLAYSNYSVIINRILAEFISTHITEYSVKLNSESEDIFDYISIQDFDALILGILSSIFPKGLEYTKACKNNLSEEDGVKVCNNIIKATLDPKKLLFVNRSALTKDMLQHMAMRRPESVTLDAVKEYQRKIKALGAKEITVLDGKVTLTIENPSINKYVDVGERWVEAIINEVESLLGAGADVSAKNAKIEDLVVTIYMGMYNSFIKSIKTNDDGRVYTDQNTIDTMVDKLSNEVVDAVNPFIEAVNKYITDSSIAIVATPAYECPECKVNDKREFSSKYGFENLVPLNMPYLFFDLGALSKQNILKSLNTY